MNIYPEIHIHTVKLDFTSYYILHYLGVTNSSINV